MEWSCSVIGVILAIHSAFSGPDEHWLEALAGGSARLPCRLAPRAGDAVEFVFWYKDEAAAALYTLDARRRALGEASHLADGAYAGRARFVADAERPHLRLEALAPRDSGSYFCRVDYRWSATQVTGTRLLVVVPPSQLVVRDQTGAEMSEVAGPYPEGADIALSCEALQGIPNPSVTWWRGDSLLDESFEALPGQRVLNEMRLQNLSRAHLASALSCRASNTRLAEPLQHSLALDLYLSPEWVRLSVPARVSAGRSLAARCESGGSRPPAALAWLLNGSALAGEQGPELSLAAGPQHHGLRLACRARNPQLPDGGLLDEKVLNVTYAPRVSLRLTPEAEGRAPREGDFVRLACEVDANPPAAKVSWLRDGRPLADAEGPTLLLRRLARAHAGTYRCSAENGEGRRESRDLRLDVMHAPLCKAGQRVTYAVALNESAEVRCEVEARPSRPLTFRWEFSNGQRSHRHLQHRAAGEAVSVATYRPRTPRDYGTLFCWAGNSVGDQRSSCFFTVIAPACTYQRHEARDGSEEAWQFPTIAAAAILSCFALLVAAACAFALHNRLDVVPQRRLTHKI